MRQKDVILSQGKEQFPGFSFLYLLPKRWDQPWLMQTLAGQMTVPLSQDRGSSAAGAGDIPCSCCQHPAFGEDIPKEWAFSELFEHVGVS